MKICPNKNIEIQSTLSKYELTEKLRQHLEFTDRFGIMGIRYDSHLVYEGYVEKDRLAFRRILKSGKNSFIPQVTGVITENDEGVKIQLNAQLHKVIQILMYVFNGLIAVPFIIGIMSFTMEELGSSIMFMLGVIVITANLNGMPRLFFSYELYRMEKDFREIVESKERSFSNDNRRNRLIESIAERLLKLI